MTSYKNILLTIALSCATPTPHTQANTIAILGGVLGATAGVYVYKKSKATNAPTKKPLNSMTALILHALGGGLIGASAGIISSHIYDACAHYRLEQQEIQLAEKLLERWERESNDWVLTHHDDSVFRPQCPATKQSTLSQQAWERAERIFLARQAREQELVELLLERWRNPVQPNAENVDLERQIARAHTIIQNRQQELNEALLEQQRNPTNSNERKSRHRAAPQKSASTKTSSVQDGVRIPHTWNLSRESRVLMRAGRYAIQHHYTNNRTAMQILEDIPAMTSQELLFPDTI